MSEMERTNVRCTFELYHSCYIVIHFEQLIMIKIIFKYTVLRKSIKLCYQVSIDAICTQNQYLSCYQAKDTYTL